MSRDGRYSEAQPVIANATELLDGRAVVPVAGTAVPLSEVSIGCQRVDIQAMKNNSGTIVIGGPTVVAEEANRTGIALEAGEGYALSIADLQDVFIDATTDGEGVTFIYQE